MSLICNVGLYHYLILSLILFCISIFGMLICKNLVKFFICVVLLFNAIGLNFIAFAVYNDSEKLYGIYFQLFILIFIFLAVVFGSYLIYCIFKYKKSSDIDKTNII